MPSPQQIVEGLTRIAGEWQRLAVVWHVALGVLLFALLLGTRPSNRLMAGMLMMPLVSVSVLAWMAGNPFNGTVFAAVVITLIVSARSLSDAPVRIEMSMPTVVGGVMVAFGWVYPHFLELGPPTAYLYAAPLGLVPCPTLSAVIGITLIAGGLGSQVWSLIIAGAGILYALFGALRLGVTIDLVLLLGAVTLVVVAVMPGGSVGGRTQSLGEGSAPRGLTHA
jgi:hypothetical protein